MAGTEDTQRPLTKTLDGIRGHSRVQACLDSLSYTTEALMGPTFVISLDFELFWGVLESKTLAGYGRNILGVHDAIPAMLKLFETYRVKATFATVGLLFLNNSNALRDCWPTPRPDYRNSRLSSYNFPFEDGPYFFAPELVQLLLGDSPHEIATHTFSHYYCGAEGADLVSFEADLLAALRAGRNLGLEQTSIVFPRNQVRDSFLEICDKVGLRCFRGNQSTWVYLTAERTVWGRVLRLLDSYLNLTGHNCQSWARLRHPSGLTNVSASAMLRPHRPSLPWLDRLQLRRIRNSMMQAARTGSIYHLWWHPHNFGANLEQNLQNLENILRFYQTLSLKYGMASRTMKEVAECSKTLY